MSSSGLTDEPGEVSAGTGEGEGQGTSYSSAVSSWGGGNMWRRPVVIGAWRKHSELRRNNREDVL